jgi:hypothetical protein
MKKLIAILAVLMLVPFSAFGLEALSEDVLDDVTGQAGVSINLDVNIASVTMDTLAWGDSDGVSYTDASGTVTTHDGGWVGMSDFNMTDVEIHPRFDWVYGSDAEKAQLQFVTIDVATDPNPDPMSALYNGATYVHINPGTLEIVVESMTTDIALGKDAAAGLTQNLGSVGMTGLLIRLGQDNFIDIYSGQSVLAGLLGFPAASGVKITFDINIDMIHMDSLTWGDDDGIMDAGVTTGGTIGAFGFDITDMTLDGTVTIDVVTIGTGAVAITSGTPAHPTTIPEKLAIYSNVVYIYTLLNANNVTATGSRLTSESYVHIGLDNINVHIGTLATNVGFSAASGDTLGSIYGSNININGINGFVDIFAH